MSPVSVKNWSPFKVCPGDQHAPAPRAIESKEGVGDRLRAAAFAEIQARDAFLWAADFFQDAPPVVQDAWRTLAAAEEKHLGWLLKRMEELKIDVQDRPVSSRLWDSFMKCKSAEEFALYMATAEERGRIAGERFCEALKKLDPISAEIFRKIAEEEIEHIQLAQKYFAYSSETLAARATKPLVTT